MKFNYSGPDADRLPVLQEMTKADVAKSRSDAIIYSIGWLAVAAMYCTTCVVVCG